MTHPIRRSDRGASAVEYALLASAIAAVIAAIVFIFGGHVGGLFHNTCDTVVNQTGQSACP